MHRILHRLKRLESVRRCLDIPVHTLTVNFHTAFSARRDRTNDTLTASAGNAQNSHPPVTAVDPDPEEKNAAHINDNADHDCFANRHSSNRGVKITPHAFLRNTATGITVLFAILYVN